LSAENTSAPEGRAALSSSALFQRAAELWVSTATAAAYRSTHAGYLLQPLGSARHRSISRALALRLSQALVVFHKNEGQRVASWFSRSYEKFNAILRDHIAPASAPVSALIALCVGAIAIYTNVHALKIMSLQQEQFEAGRYQQYQGSVALAWRSIGEANGKPFEVGQSTSLYYLAANSELNGNVTLNKSYLSLTPTKASAISAPDRVTYLAFDLNKSALCGTEISKYAARNGRWVNFSYALLRRAALFGTYFNDDFLAADLQAARFVNVRAENARFAASDLRNTIFAGGQYSEADFQGADLRGARTYRGEIGLGSRSGGYFFSPDGVEFGFDPDYRAKWPALFDPQLGINDVLAKIGQPAPSEGGSYLVDFSRADFTGADLRGAQLENSNISQAQINQACVDSTTKFPEGRTAARPCGFPDQHQEKLAAVRTPLRSNPLERTCAAALKTDD
jgi:uncharacterized protein YjbI with pentapeptide repeats